MKRIKAIQIGIGHDHAIAILDSICYLSQYFDIVAIGIPTEEQDLFFDRILKCEKISGLSVCSVDEAMSIDGIEAAIIETEEKNLFRYAQMAADQGLHVHMDKPGGLDPQAYQSLLTTLQKKDLVFTTGYMYRFNPTIQKALEKVRSGAIGAVYSIEAHMDCEHPSAKREWLSQFPGGMMFYLGCHLIDLVYRFLGKPQKVIPYNTATEPDQIAAQDFSMAVFQYDNGFSIIKTCANEPGGFLRRQLVICGTKGTIEIRPLEVYDFDHDPRKHLYSAWKQTPANGDWNSQAYPFVQSEYSNRYDPMMENFAKILRKEIENPYPYAYEWEVYQLLLQACGGIEQ